MNIFTSFFVLLLLLYKNMPSNAEHIPRIGKIDLISATIVMNYQERRVFPEMKYFVRTKHFLFSS